MLMGKGQDYALRGGGGGGKGEGGLERKSFQ